MSDTTSDTGLSEDEIDALGWEAKRVDYYYTTIHPAVADAFDTHPWLQSVGVCVAQFWDDEADDAVHVALIYSQLDDPDIDYGLQRRHDDGRDDPVEVRYDDINLPGGLGKSHYDLEAYDNTGRWRLLPWDDNGAAIELFASYCREGAHQNMALNKSYSLWAVVRRVKDSNGISIEVVGDRCRPWLDGVTASWSD